MSFGGACQLEAGIDEAGRGPVIGPMVVACVVARRARLKALKDRLRDSKRLTPRRREKLYGLIAKVAEEVKVKVVDPPEIDTAVTEGKLNFLEARVAAELVDTLSLPVEIVYIDSPDTLPQRYAALVGSLTKLKGVKLVAAHHAESLYPHVAAASIVAKVTRDRIIRKLHKLYGDFGSGYPSDPKTRRYLISLLNKGEELPPIVRKSWRTIAKLGSRS